MKERLRTLRDGYLGIAIMPPSDACCGLRDASRFHLN